MRNCRDNYNNYKNKIKITLLIFVKSKYESVVC